MSIIVTVPFCLVIICSLFLLIAVIQEGLRECGIFWVNSDLMWTETIFESAHEKMVLIHRRPAMAQSSLRKSAVSPEPLLFADL